MSGIKREPSYAQYYLRLTHIEISNAILLQLSEFIVPYLLRMMMLAEDFLLDAANDLRFRMFNECSHFA